MTRGAAISIAPLSIVGVVLVAGAVAEHRSVRRQTPPLSRSAPAILISVLPFLLQVRPRVMIGADVRSITKVDISPFPCGQRFDSWILLLQLLLNDDIVLLQCSTQCASDRLGRPTELTLSFTPNLSITSLPIILGAASKLGPRPLIL
jgi:hypothetical protein